MSRLDQHGRMQQAIVLIRRGLRTSIVSRISGVGPALLRELHHEIHGCSPAAGLLPTTSGLLRSSRIQASASVLVAIYRAFGGDGINHRVDVNALLRAHALYVTQILSAAPSGELGVPLDLTQAWAIARDLTTGLTTLRFCERCAVHYLVADFSRTALDCPICVVKGGRRSRNIATMNGPPPTGGMERSP
ncbi:FlhC family transcriptional regulator [uncultured Thiocystis sp.]|uniref:FlhC family transcriptional regulator n=1 Tax=uncultured Thiocystis sp. TaxID=1202134 RepID=UPI0025EDE36A|nr:FlhC family transcriptional regulator [uncultured Thiocystis sp.]